MNIIPSASILLAAALSLLPMSARAGGDDAVPPLYDNIGSYHRQVSTGSPAAQKYVDQGLRFLYAFHYGEASRAFEYAAALDPSCVMAWWGVASAHGPHINDPTVSAEQAKIAVDALQKASASAGKTAPVE